MNRSRFVRLAVVAFGLVVASFVVRGVTRLVASYDLAILLSAPLLFLGAATVIRLLVAAVLDLVGIREIE